MKNEGEDQANTLDLQVGQRKAMGESGANWKNNIFAVGIWNPEDWNPESTMVWNPESTVVWNPESRSLESGIQRVGIQNPDAGIRNVEARIQNPGPSWILLHKAKKSM